MSQFDAAAQIVNSHAAPPTVASAERLSTVRRRENDVGRLELLSHAQHREQWRSVCDVAVDTVIADVNRMYLRDIGVKLVTAVIQARPGRLSFYLRADTAVLGNGKWDPRDHTPLNFVSPEPTASLDYVLSQQQQQ